MKTKMCINCKHSNTEIGMEHPEGICVYNPPVVCDGKDKGVFPAVYLNWYCSKWEYKDGF